MKNDCDNWRPTVKKDFFVRFRQYINCYCTCVNVSTVIHECAFTNTILYCMKFVNGIRTR